MSDEWRPEDCESRTDCHQRHEALNQQQTRIAELEAENERLLALLSQGLAKQASSAFTNMRNHVMALEAELERLRKGSNDGQ